jgi:hypothetical protein
MADREILWWDCEDPDILSYEEPDAAIENYLDCLAVDNVSELPETVTLNAYAKVEVNLEKEAADVLDYLLDFWNDEYGGPDDRPEEATSSMKAAAEEFIKKVFAEYDVRACEKVSEREINVQEWVKKNRPDWLEKDGE